MITNDYLRSMARYNRWQNESLYDAANTLSDEARREDRGAFFGSIHATLSHITGPTASGCRALTCASRPMSRTRKAVSLSKTGTSLSPSAPNWIGR